MARAAASACPATQAASPRWPASASAPATRARALACSCGTVMARAAASACGATPAAPARPPARGRLLPLASPRKRLCDLAQSLRLLMRVGDGAGGGLGLGGYPGRLLMPPRPRQRPRDPGKRPCPLTWLSEGLGGGASLLVLARPRQRLHDLGHSPCLPVRVSDGADSCLDLHGQLSRLLPLACRRQRRHRL